MGLGAVFPPSSTETQNFFLQVHKSFSSTETQNLFFYKYTNLFPLRRHKSFLQVTNRFYRARSPGTNFRPYRTPIRFLVKWLQGKGAVFQSDIMEDAAGHDHATHLKRWKNCHNWHSTNDCIRVRWTLIFEHEWNTISKLLPSYTPSQLATCCAQTYPPPFQQPDAALYGWPNPCVPLIIGHLLLRLRVGEWGHQPRGQRISAIS